MSNAPRHGSVSEPPSRADIYLEPWQAAGLEAGKFFPATEAGLRDPYAPDDTVNAQPPEDGRIASAGKDFAMKLDEPRTDWTKHPVNAGQTLEISWNFHAPHKTRRWNYFLTRPGWDPSAPLTRAQFEGEPFHSVQLSCQPYWSCDDLMPENPTTHIMRLPERPAGHQVMLAVWEVADTGNAFYQVIDLEYR
ncbi:lytic polysaccharide monooxygenase auxiliary activity family 9 protein [Wenjunlia tyrosinilytica]|uniref:Chitin-binding protein n=1 Tax=Wenjunlia tyrosinilytica TaxID=1544741 RepID=A0A918E041_9ACTN|nr:lytic polysaccharide monooxygenase auxiliary activity family 9 protein [Wenjunlia tyrosinilytica]GGO92024.1 chitin-binding protein [Wenjunlia tyrosinilytica]